MELLLNGKKKKISINGNLESLIKKLRLRREEVIVKINGKLSPETYSPKKSDKIEIIQVVFGG